MKTHEHYYRIDKKSTFGLTRVNAVLRCVGMVDGKQCQDTMVNLLAYSECDQKTTKVGATTYFWPKKTI